MASYPDNLTHVVKKLTGWSQNTVKITPGTLTTADPLSVTVFTLPENSLVSLESLAICGAIMGVRGSGATDQCVLPRNIESTLDMISVEINGVAVDSSCLNVNHLYKIFDDFKNGNAKSADSVLGLASDYLGGATSRALARIGRTNADAAAFGVDVAAINNTAFNADLAAINGMNSFPFAIRNFMGFLGQRKWIDTSILGTVKILIRWAPGSITMGTNASTYRLHDLKMYCNVADLSDGLYYSSMAARLESGPISIPFKRYLSYTGPAVASSSSIRFSCSTQSLDALFCALIPTANATTRTAPQADNAVAPYFQRVATGVVSNQLDLNSTLYPAFQANVADCYYLLKNAFGTQVDETTGAQPQLTFASWAADFFVFAYRWSHGAGLEYTSGVDSRGLQLSGAWNIITSTNTNATPYLWAECTAYLNIGKFRSLSLVS